MNANIQEVKAHLGLAPRTAQDLAESTGLPIEAVYQVLVGLNDRNEARMEKGGWRSGEVIGWVEGVNA